MKRTLPFLIVAIITIFAFTGCYSNKQPVYVNSVSAMIDSLQFNATGSQQAGFLADTATHNPQLLDIFAKTILYTPGTAVLPSIQLTMPISDGTYSIPGQVSAKIITARSGSAGTTAVSGQIIVIRYAYGRIQGNFSFTCADGTVVSGGQFIGVVGYP